MMREYRSKTLDIATKLLAVHSPSGYTAKVAETLASMVLEMGYPAKLSNKGSIVIPVKGKRSDKRLCLCAHVDTLGLMLRSIGEDASLRFTVVGGPIVPTLDGEYCTVFTRDGSSYTGTILSRSPAAHVFKDASTLERNEETMYVRLDERVQTREEVRALGIEVGDFICIDTKTQVTESGFLKSRFIDDKASAACLLTLLQAIADKALIPQYDTDFIFTVYEEVGHGACDFDDYDEILAVDMGCIGDDLSCNEFQVSICAKDASGPYDYALTGQLIELAKARGLDYAVDIYPYYSSDASAARRAGNSARCALIGPGVHASHGMERTHADALEQTLCLCAAYLGVF